MYVDAMATESTMGKVREPIFVAIPFDRLRKQGALKQKANVSLGKTQMDKMVRRRESPCARQSRLLYKKRVVRGVAYMSMEKK
jgi:hypothetical protein